MSTSLSLYNICHLIVDCEHKTAPLSATGYGYPSIRTPNIGKGRLLLDGVNRVDETTFRAWTNRAVPQAGDLIIAREAPVGNVAFIPSGLQVCLGQRTVLIRPDLSKVSSRFLCYFLLGDYAQGRFRAATTGATVSHLNMRDIRNLLVPYLPPLHEQRRIASILSAYDDLIEVNRRRVAILEEMARRLFEEWFVQLRFPGHEAVSVRSTPAGPLPEGWDYRPLGHLVTEARDAVLPADLDAATMYVGLEHIPRRSTTLTDWGRAEDVVSAKLRFRRGDVLFGKIRPYFHKVVVAPADGVSSTDAIVLRSKLPQCAGIVTAVVSSDAFVAHAVQTSNGTKMPRANWPVLAHYLVRVPQQALLSQFNSFVMNGLNHAISLAAANTRLAAARNLLLPRLISGELSIADAPAPDRLMEAAD